MSDTQAWRLSLIVELEADDLDAAGKIGEAIFAAAGPVIKNIDGVRWLLPVGDFKEREPFATAAR
jgi:hypothetical protein